MPIGAPSSTKMMQAMGMENFLWISTRYWAILVIRQSVSTTTSSTIVRYLRSLERVMLCNSCCAEVDSRVTSTKKLLARGAVTLGSDRELRRRAQHGVSLVLTERG